MRERDRLPFGAHLFYGRGRRANELDSTGLTQLSKVLVLREKAISRVDGLCGRGGGGGEMEVGEEERRGGKKGGEEKRKGGNKEERAAIAGFHVIKGLSLHPFLHIFVAINNNVAHLCPCCQGNLHDPILAEVALIGGGGSNTVSLVCLQVDI